MTPEAIILMVVSILVIWGGLVASIVALNTMTSPQYPGYSQNASGDNTQTE